VIVLCLYNSMETKFRSVSVSAIGLGNLAAAFCFLFSILAHCSCENEVSNWTFDVRMDILGLTIRSDDVVWEWKNFVNFPNSGFKDDLLFSGPVMLKVSVDGVRVMLCLCGVVKSSSGELATGSITDSESESSELYFIGPVSLT
jgi:hypothetical protein